MPRTVLEHLVRENCWRNRGRETEKYLDRLTKWFGLDSVVDRIPSVKNSKLRKAVTANALRHGT